MIRRFVSIAVFCVSTCMVVSCLFADTKSPDLFHDKNFRIDSHDLFLFSQYWKSSNQAPHAADFNNDLAIDLLDLLHFRNQYGMLVPTWTPTATFTPSPTHTPTATDTPSPTPSMTPSQTPSITPTFSPTFTHTITPTFTPRFTPTSSPSPEPTRPPTPTVTPTPTNTPKPRLTPVPTNSGQQTPTIKATGTPIDPNFNTPTPNTSPTGDPSHLTPTITQPEKIRLWHLHHHLNLFPNDNVYKPGSFDIASSTHGYAVYTHTKEGAPRFISIDRFGRIYNRELPISIENYSRISLVDGAETFGKFFESPPQTFRFRFEPFTFDQPANDIQDIDHLEADAMMWTYIGSEWGTIMVILRYPDTVTVHRVAPDGAYLGSTDMKDPGLNITPHLVRAAVSGDTIAILYATEDQGRHTELTAWFLNREGELLADAPLKFNASLYLSGIVGDGEGRFFLVGRNASLPYLMLYRFSAEGVELQQPLALANPLDYIRHDDLLWFLEGDSHSIIGIDDDGMIVAESVNIFPPGWDQPIQWLDIKRSGPDLGVFFSDKEETSVHYMQIEAGPWVTPTPIPASGSPTGATLEVEIAEGFPLEMVEIPSGSFTMGSPEDEIDGRIDERPQHHITLTENFYMSKYEITNKQYRVFNPNHAVNPINDQPIDADNLPVVNISWDDAKAYCDWLSTNTDHTFDLPTEAEWEYACRAGTTTRRYWGTDAANTEACAYANIADASSSERFSFNKPFSCSDGFIGPAPVGSFPPNDFGVYDMLGNAWEWCSDWFALYADEEQVNPTGPAEGKSKIFRGGSWGAGIHKIRCAVRSALPPTEKHTRIGFRVVIRE